MSWYLSDNDASAPRLVPTVEEVKNLRNQEGISLLEAKSKVRKRLLRKAAVNAAATNDFDLLSLVVIEMLSDS